MVVGVGSFEVTEADGVELIHKVRYLSPLDVEKNLAHTHIDFLHRLLQTSNPFFFESTAMAEVVFLLRNWIVYIKCIAADV